VALFPCDGHGGRYAGKQQTIYPAILDGSTSVRQKKRLCPSCFDSLLGWIESNMVDGATDDAGDIKCAACHQIPSGKSVVLFATVYADKSERHDFYGVGCLDHALELTAALGLN